MLASLVRLLLVLGSVSGFRTARYGFEAVKNASRPTWLAQCNAAVSSAACCNAWSKKVERHFDLLSLQYHESSLYHYAHLAHNTTEAYDLQNPTWNCELSERVPATFGDGPKHVCGMDALRERSKCLVYSFGSNGHVDFETALKERLPLCEIHTFDPFLNIAGREAKLDKVRAAEKRAVLTYQNLGLVGDGSELKWKGEALPHGTFSEIVEKLGHRGRELDVLKVDVEGSEFGALSHSGLFGGCLASGAPKVPIRQVQIEVHGQSFVDIFRLAEQMHTCGLALFSKEPNHWGCDGYKCVELSFVGPQHAWESYKLSHPSCAGVAGGR